MAIITGPKQPSSQPPRDRRITVAVDFDGVIHHRPKTERGGEDVTGLPIPGAMNFIRHLVTAAHVVIFTARLDTEDVAQHKRTTDNIKFWMKRHMCDEADRLVILGKPSFDIHAVLDALTYTAVKPKYARVFLDDRAIRFDGNWPSIPDILKFKTWEES